MNRNNDQIFEYASGELDGVAAERFLAGLSAAERAEAEKLRIAFMGLRELRDDVPECQLSPERLRAALDADSAKQKRPFWVWKPWMPAAALGSLVGVAFLVNSMQPQPASDVPPGVSIARLDGAMAGNGPIGSKVTRQESINANPETVTTAPVPTLEVQPPKEKPAAAPVESEVQGKKPSYRKANRKRPQRRPMVVADARPVPTIDASIAKASGMEAMDRNAALSGSGAPAMMPGGMEAVPDPTSTQPVTIVRVDEQSGEAVQQAVEVKKSNDVVIGS